MNERWKPKFDEAYYCIFANGNIDKTVWRNIPTDNNLFERGNCFKTEEEAESAAEKVKALLLSLHKPVAECNQLPKLTAEVFDRPDCPEWAKYAAVDANGDSFYYEDKPRACEADREWLVDKCIVGTNRIIADDFDPTDWRNSLIKRPAKLPEWCKVGEWVWVKSAKSYEKITEISGTTIMTKHLFWDVSAIGKTVFQARLRPYNEDEMKALVGEILTDKDGSMNIIDGWSVDIKKVRVDHLYYSAVKLLNNFTIDGKPCGKLEHLENGEWVE